MLIYQPSLISNPQQQITTLTMLTYQPLCYIYMLCGLIFSFNQYFSKNCENNHNYFEASLISKIIPKEENNIVLTAYNYPLYIFRVN